MKLARATFFIIHAGMAQPYRLAPPSTISNVLRHSDD